MKRFFVLLACSAALAGCMMEPAEGPTPTKSPPVVLSAVEYTCAAGTAALKTVIEFNAKLTPANRAMVARASNTLNPVCSQETLPTLSSTAQAALTGAMTNLTSASIQVTE